MPIPIDIAPRPTVRTGRAWTWPLLAIAWLAVAASAVLWATQKASIAGDAGAPPAAWPNGSPVAHPAGAFTGVLLVHPQCGCTNATVSELARLLTDCGGALRVTALVYRPAGIEDWSSAAIVGRLRAMPGVSVIDDIDGAEAQRFGVSTSGHLLVFSPGGRLAYSGGITTARGHEGQSTGRAAVTSIVRWGRAADPRSNVFGCSIDGKESP